MCSLYPPDRRTICACFMGKDEKVADEMAAGRAEALLWASAGSGVVSLADLDAELYGQRPWDPAGPPDREFLAACRERSILLFGVIFCAQGYEVEVEITEDGRLVSGFGKAAGRGHTWGLSASYRGELSGIWRPAREYYTAGEWEEIGRLMPGGDFLEAAVCRGIRGEKSLCHWVNATDQPGELRYTNHYMCTNSPLWTAHLKKMIELQIAAGLDGIHFDEPAIAIETAATQANFCPNCKSSLRAYLERKHGSAGGVFDLQAEALRRGTGFPSELAYFRGLPHWRDYKRWLLESIVGRHRELVAHTQHCAEKAGRKVLTSANYFNLFPHHLALSQYTDVVAYEFTPSLPPGDGSVLYHEVARLVAGERPVTGVPDIAFATLLRERARERRDTNLLQYFIAEAELAGGSFMLPYSCLGLSGEGAYYPPAEPVAHLRDFLNRHESHSLPQATRLPDVQLVLSFPSYFWSFDFLSVPGAHFRALADASARLRENLFSYELVLWGDGDLVKDKGMFSPERPVLLPRVLYLSDDRWDKLLAYVRQGGRAVLLGTCGRYDENGNERHRPLSSGFGEGLHKLGSGRILGISSARAAGSLVQGLRQELSAQPQLSISGANGSHIPLASVRRTGSGISICLFNRDYEPASDIFQPAKGLTLEWRGREKPRKWVFHAPDRESIDLAPDGNDGHVRVHLPECPVLAYVEGRL